MIRKFMNWLKKTFYYDEWRRENVLILINDHSAEMSRIMRDDFNAQWANTNPTPRPEPPPCDKLVKAY